MIHPFAASVFICLVWCQYCSACTAFQIKSQDGAAIYCRSMELGVDLQSNLLVVPRGAVFKGTAPNQQPGMPWKALYGFVGVNQWIAPKFVSDGMNEKGLVVGALYLPGFTEYEKPISTRNNRTLGAWELTAYLLGTCSDLNDVKNVLTQIIVAQQPIPEINFSLPLHFYIADKQGRVLIVEYVEGVRRVYEDRLGALTNAPTFDWHLNNLSNFVNLSPLNVTQLKLVNDSIKAAGQGSGLLGIPGDYTPPSRFVRAALFSQWAAPARSAEETALLGFHILNTFDIFFGIVRESASVKNSLSRELETHIASSGHRMEDSEFTQWTVVHDRANLKTYFRSYKSLKIQMVDFKKLDFSQPGLKEIKTLQEFMVDDISLKTQPLKL